MTFKYAVGQAVEYRPVGGKVGLFTVLQQMPEEFRAFDRKYRIKNQREGFERNVLECDLAPAENPPEDYKPPTVVRRTGGHH